MSDMLADLLSTGFDGAIAVVTGGAGGVGAAVVRQLAAQGARVVVASRSGDRLDPDRVAPPGGEAITAALDLTDPASIRAFADWAGVVLGRIDILVNSAGVTRSVPLDQIDQLDDALIDLVMTSNATGVIRLIRDLRPLLDRGEQPCIVNISSVAARTGVGSNIAYIGAKAAMDGVTGALAKALAPRIRVLGVAPSALDTPFAKGRGQDFIDRTVAATPLGRLATTTEVANAVLCAARLLTATTGIVIAVDGGRHL
jgi:3-oxoacyl-[acyl-carrier protein] reductase